MLDRVTMNVHAIDKLKHWCGLQGKNARKDAPVLVLDDFYICFWQSYQPLAAHK